MVDSLPTPIRDPEERSLHVLLIGNYALDRQESMLRFADVLLRRLPQYGIRVTHLRPAAFFGRLAPARSASGKWLGYLDKFILFPLALRRAIREAVRTQDQSTSQLIAHICDHSNAMYSAHTAPLPLVVTCHDLLAVRGALGEATDCPASRTGRILQRWILRGLSGAQLLVCDSTATRLDAERLVSNAVGKTRLVLLGQNHEFSVRPPAECDRLMASVSSLNPLFPTGTAPAPYLLNVGSSLRRKNRDGSLRILERLRDRWNGWLVFAGEPLTAEQRELSRNLGIADRVLEVARPEDTLLEALYNRAYALLFPSRFEGFGWPVIEAQACGCPVVCSAEGPIPEVAGEGAIILDVEDEGGIADAVLKLTDPDQRRTLVEKGRNNVERFETERMIEQYIAAYREVAAVRMRHYSGYNVPGSDILIR